MAELPAPKTKPELQALYDAHVKYLISLDAAVNQVKKKIYDLRQLLDSN